MTTFSLPGIPNIHSHAFQRAMAGLAERREGDQDSFWTWRELMYRFASRITPEAMHDIAAQLFVEMLQSGYTSTCEFHYLHHQPDGQVHADPAEMSKALIQAAADTGIRLTLLPVLYMAGGFDGRSLGDRQRRFGHGVDSFLRLVESLRALESPLLRVGIALHSLRAVPADAMGEVLHACGALGAMPVHIHIAEQLAEVEECIEVRGERPVRWLLDNAKVDENWTLVHATHLDQSEVEAIAGSGAVVAICPTTEANLGDGFFPLRDFLAQGGRFGIGSDSNVSVSPVEELRWLEYGQRLLLRERNIASSTRHPGCGTRLLLDAVSGGQRANGHGVQDEDRLVLDGTAACMVGATDQDVRERFVFAGNRNLVSDVFVAGRKVIAGGAHAHGPEILQRYRATLGRLLAAD